MEILCELPVISFLKNNNSLNDGKLLVLSCNLFVMDVTTIIYAFNTVGINVLLLKLTRI